MKWRRLLAGSAIAMAATFAIVAVALTDVEAGLFVLAPIAGLLLLRFRSGLLGEIELAAICPYVMAWMAPAAVSNLTGRAPMWAVAAPAALTVVAYAGLKCAIACLLRRRSMFPSDAFAPAVAVFAAAVLAVAVAASALRGPPPPAASDVRVAEKDVKFSPERVEARAGGFTLAVKNHDLFWHTFTIRELDVDIRTPVGAERIARIDAEPGTYEFICAIPGHDQAGMNGTLVVR